MPAINQKRTNRRVTLVSGDKGGVGKSAATRGVAEFLDQNAVEYLLYDGDVVNPTLTRFFKDKSVRLDTRTVKGFEPLINNLEHQTGYQLVDLGGGTSMILRQFIEKTDFLETAKQMGTPITVFFVLFPSVDSINLLKILSEKYPELQYVLAKAEFGNGTWELWNDSKTRSRLIENKAIEISIPALDGEAFSIADNNSLKWAEAAESKTLPLAPRSYVKRWRKDFLQQLDIARDYLLP